MSTGQSPSEPSQDDLAVLEQFRAVLGWEADCLARNSQLIGTEAVQAIRRILACSGRVILTGMGKMGYVARKAAATFCSTGTPALFLHPVEAFHGDLGVVCPGDLLIALSGGGETSEVIGLVPFMRARGIEVIAITCRTGSTLARACQVVLGIDVEREAEPDSGAPTASTTVALAICDALAVAAMQARGFTRAAFAELHPGGFLGRRLLTRVEELMHGGDRLPLIDESATVREAILVISQKGLGCALVCGANRELLGVFTDGDLRRALGQEGNPLSEPIIRFMSGNPVSINAGTLAADAIRIMEQRSITVLPVLDPERVPMGVVHLHDLVQAGLK